LTSAKAGTKSDHRSPGWETSAGPSRLWPRKTVMNFKRKRPKSTRAGCLLCKPHKRQGSCLQHRDRFGVYRKSEAARRDISTYLCERT
jgi:hypothetical protein